MSERSTTADLIVGLAWESWGGPRRGAGFLTSDRFVHSVLADDRLDRILIVNAPRSVQAMVARRITGQKRIPAPSPTATVTTPLRIRRQAPTEPSAVERSMQQYVRHVQRRAKRSGLRDPAMVTANPLVAGFASFDWPVTYFAFDDWLAHPRFTHLEAALEVAYDRIANNGISVVAVSQTLLDRLAPSGPALVVPNGLEGSEWRQPGPAPTWLEPVSRPRAVYVGGLDERMDVQLLTATIDAMPHISFVLVGAGHDKEPYLSLGERTNVTVHAPIGREELTALVAGCDLGLVPHQRNELTQSMSPLKVYEYLAAGLPVAAVDLEPMRGIDERVVLAEPEFFVQAVERALEHGPMPESVRQTFIDQNDWASRHRHIVDLAIGHSVGSGT